MKPEFHLGRVFENGSREEPQIVPVAEMPWSTLMDRRGALAAGLGLSGVLAMIGCAKPEQQAAPPKPRPKPAPPPKECSADPASIVAHRNGVTSIVVTADGKTIVSAGGDGTLKSWSLPGGKRMAMLNENVSQLALTPDGKLVAGVRVGKGIGIWSLPQLKRVKLLATDQVMGSPLAISPRGDLLAASFAEPRIRFWSLPAGEPAPPLELPELQPSSIAISPDGALLGVGCADGTVQVWRLGDRRLHLSLKPHKLQVASVVFGADGKTFLSGASERAVKIWAMPAGTVVNNIDAEEGISELDAAADLVAFAGVFKMKVKLCSASDGRYLGSLDGHRYNVSALALAADGATLASGDFGGGVVVWDLAEWRRSGTCSRTFLFDRSATDESAKAMTYEVETTSKQTITYTLPCGSPIPAGATCTCNCVSGRWSPPPPPEPDYDSGGYGGTICTCNKICTCVPISSRRWKRNIEPLRAPLVPRNVAHEVTLLVEAIQSQQRRLADLRRRMRG